MFIFLLFIFSASFVSAFEEVLPPRTLTISVDYHFGNPAELTYSLQKNLKVIADAWRELCRVLSHPICQQNSPLGGAVVPQGESFNKELMSFAERKYARSSQPKKPIDFSKSNCVFVRLLVNDDYGKKQEWTLARINESIVWVPKGKLHKEICFVSGSVEQKVECNPFAWMQVGPYDLCQKQSFRDENYQRDVILKFLAMESQDPESLFAKLMAENEVLVEAVRRFKSLDQSSSEEEKRSIVLMIFKELNRQVITPEGSPRPLSIFDQLNALFCAEETMSGLLRQGFALPLISPDSSVSVILYTRWTLCIACADRLKWIFQPLLEGLKHVYDIKKYIIASEPYSSVKRGFPNSCRDEAVPDKNGYCVLLARPVMVDGAHSPNSPVRTRKTASTLSQEVRLANPGSAQRTLEKKDFPTPLRLDQGTQVTPPPMPDQDGAEKLRQLMGESGDCVAVPLDFSTPVKKPERGS